MLAAFEDRYSTIIPFKNILRVQVNVNGEIAINCQSYSKTLRLDFKNSEIRDQQLANFKKWLTIRTNSI